MASNNVTVIGLQWGDEGKGKLVDALTGSFDYVVRYCGGANAGHTVRVGEETYALHLIPSGILRPGVHNVVGNGVVLDATTLLEEIAGLRGRGVRVTGENLHLSSRAHLVMPYHKLGDSLNERSLADGKKIGTTARGIGPCYADKASRTLAVRVGDLFRPEVLRDKLEGIVAHKTAAMNALYGDGSARLSAGELFDQLQAQAGQLREFVCDTTAMLHQAVHDGQRILFEGAQGSLLDLDHGTFPFVTSSSVTACGVPSGAGVPPKAVGRVVGVIKAYNTRVGAGPFPTEQDNAVGQLIRERGHEYGTTTGRPRRCGWFDAVAGRYAADLSGVDELAVMLLDVLSTVGELRICTGYRCRGERLPGFEPDVATLAEVECEYETLPGWQEDLSACTSFRQLPKAARDYIGRIEELLGRPVGVISVGPKRPQTILHRTKLKELAE